MDYAAALAWIEQHATKAKRIPTGGWTIEWILPGDSEVIETATTYCPNVSLPFAVAVAAQAYDKAAASMKMPQPA